jgi:hypothetical protein
VTRGINHDGVPAVPSREDVTFERRYGIDALNAELQRAALHDAVGNQGWSTDLSVQDSRSIVALMRTVDGCEAFRLVSYPPIREYHVPILRSSAIFLQDPTSLPPVHLHRRTYRLKAIERRSFGMLMRAVYEEVV